MGFLIRSPQMLVLVVPFIAFGLWRDLPRLRADQLRTATLVACAAVLVVVWAIAEIWWLTGGPDWAGFVAFMVVCAPLATVRLIAPAVDAGLRVIGR